MNLDLNIVFKAQRSITEFISLPDFLCAFISTRTKNIYIREVNNVYELHISLIFRVRCEPFFRITDLVFSSFKTNFDDLNRTSVPRSSTFVFDSRHLHKPFIRVLEFDSFTAVFY